MPPSQGIDLRSLTNFLPGEEVCHRGGSPSILRQHQRRNPMRIRMINDMIHDCITNDCSGTPNATRPAFISVTNRIRTVMSPLDGLAALRTKADEPAA